MTNTTKNKKQNVSRCSMVLSGKKLLLLALTAFALNAHAQLNLKWSNTQSLSGGIYKSAPVGLGEDSTQHWFTASNEYFEPTGDSIKGFITKYDSSGNLQWNLTLTPAVSVVNFPYGGIVNNLGSYGGLADIVVAYNTTHTIAHLIKVNPNGTIAWDIVVSGINNISVGGYDGNDIYVYGRTPMSICGGFPCNGIAVAKYDTTGQHLWTRVRYTSNLRTRPIEIAVDNAGNIVVCGKKASVLSSANYNQTFVLKYAPDGTFLWQKEFNETTTETLSDNGCTHWLSVDLSNNIYFATQVSDTANNINTTKLRKISGINGDVQWIKTINNSELNGLDYEGQGDYIILATSIGMKAYNSTGTLIWSNSYQIIKNNILTDAGSILEIISKNVSPLEPLKNYFVQLNTSTGAVIYQKDLSVNEVYLGSYCGLQGIDYDNEFVMLINDTTAPYGTRVIKLSSCSAFTYAFSASAIATDVSNSTCNNGEVSVSWSGTFNSWAHLEIYDDQSNFPIAQADIGYSGAGNYIFQNLFSGNYTVKVFDESCGEQVFNEVVKCPKPTSGFTPTNITNSSAQVNWNNTSCNNGYRVQFRLQGISAWKTIPAATNNKLLTGLLSGKTYEWRVATRCVNSSPAVYSDYSPIKTFKTLSLGNTKMSAGIGEEIINLNIYPNPANEILNAVSEIEYATQLKIKIIDATGKEKINFTEKAQEGTWQKEIDLSGLTTGIYLIRIETTEGMTEIRRFIKQ